MEIISQAYPEAEAAANTLETGLSNCNPTQHPPIMILNAGLLDRTGGDFLFYNEGVTPAVIATADTEEEETFRIITHHVLDTCGVEATAMILATSDIHPTFTMLDICVIEARQAYVASRVRSLFQVRIAIKKDM